MAKKETWSLRCKFQEQYKQTGISSKVLINSWKNERHVEAGVITEKEPVGWLTTARFMLGIKCGELGTHEKHNECNGF